MIYNYLWYFIIFSFGGWCLEVAYHAVKCGRFVNRGFLSGMVCPIYGTGVVLAGLLLRGIESHILLFIVSLVITTAVELAVGFLMDRIFDSRWWDYSSERFNFFGYICPRFSIVWGVLCAVCVRLLIPLDLLIGFLDNAAGYIIVAGVLLLMIADTVASTVRAVSFNRRLALLDRVAAEISDTLTAGSNRIGEGIYKGTSRLYAEYERALTRAAMLGVRIIDAFPTFRSKKYNDQIVALREKLEQLREKRSTRTAAAENDGMTAPQGAEVRDNIGGLSSAEREDPENTNS